MKEKLLETFFFENSSYKHAVNYLKEENVVTVNNKYYILSEYDNFQKAMKDVFYFYKIKNLK